MTNLHYSHTASKDLEQHVHDSIFSMRLLLRMLVKELPDEQFGKCPDISKLSTLMLHSTCHELFAIKGIKPEEHEELHSSMVEKLAATYAEIIRTVEKVA